MRLAGKTTAACAASRTCPSFTPTDGACRVRNPRDVSDRALEIVDTLQVPRILTNKWPTIFRICERAAGSECAGSSWDNRQGRTCGQGDAEEHLKRRKGMGNSGTFRAKVQVSTRCDASYFEPQSTPRALRFKNPLCAVSSHHDTCRSYGAAISGNPADQ